MKKQNWNLIVFILSFSLALLFSFLTNKLSNNASNLIMILLILLVIAIGYYDSTLKKIYTLKNNQNKNH